MRGMRILCRAGIKHTFFPNVSWGRGWGSPALTEMGIVLPVPSRPIDNASGDNCMKQSEGYLSYGNNELA